MALLTDEVRRYIGHKGDRFAACEVVQDSEVRRFCQAIMDPDPAYAGGRDAASGTGRTAPPLFPVFVFRTPSDAPDMLTVRASDPDFDGLTPGVGNGLPELPLRGLRLLNGGAEVEFFQSAEVGDRVFQQSTYADIVEKSSKSGPMLLVTIDTLYTNQRREPLVRYRRTQIRR